MLFSIIVPIYNVSEYVEECIESVLSQDFEDYELILVDDGSIDDSGNICKKYATLDFRIKYIFKENSGLTSARKAGARIAKGEYIICLDGDDALMPKCLSYIADIIEMHKPDCISTYFLKVNEKNLFKVVSDSIPVGLYMKEDLETVRENLFYSQSIKGNNYGKIHWNIWSKVIKREIYVPCQLSISEDISLGEDIALTSLIFNRISSVYCSDVISHKYLVRRDSLSHSFSVSGTESLIKVLLQLKENMGDGNQVTVFSINLFLSAFSNASKILSYKDVKEIVLPLLQSSVDIHRLISAAIIYKATIMDSIKMFLLKHELFYPIYFCYKFFGKRN